MEERGRHLYLHCMKNHSATLGTYTVDGCGEFLAGDVSQPGGGELWCSACGCHRNFHRKVPARYASPPLAPLALELMPAAVTEGRQRRARTKFSAEQKERMGRFAEILGWRISKREREEEVERFLEETGVSRRAFMVWMHNHRNAAAQAQAAADSSGTETDDGAAAAAAATAATAAGGDRGDVEVEADRNGNA